MGDRSSSSLFSSAVVDGPCFSLGSKRMEMLLLVLLTSWGGRVLEDLQLSVLDALEYHFNLTSIIDKNCSAKCMHKK